VLQLALEVCSFFSFNRTIKIMWRGENPVEDFDRLMSVVLFDLLNQRVDRILVGMKESRIAAAVELLALKAKKGRPESSARLH